MSVAVFDINNLSLINSSYGKECGDNMLSSLADIMREYFKKDSYFVRREASLLALSYNIRKENIENAVNEVNNKFEGSVQYAIAYTSKAEPDILAAIDDAFKALHTRKLLDRDSNRSQALTSLIRALKESDADTEAHVQRTQLMGREIAKRLGLSDSKMSDLSLLCLLHDIGKIGIPLEILNKPSKLKPEEFKVISTHAEKGYQIALSSREFSHIADDILHHHERWDGNGYPTGLSKESIPLLARIIAVVDAFDAMVSDRPYRKGMPVEAALAELRKCAGTQFDPHIANLFIDMINENPSYTGQHIKEESVSVQRFPVPYSASEDMGIISNSHEVNYSKYIISMENIVIKADENFEAITGYSQEDVAAGRVNQFDLIPEEDKNEYIVLVTNILSTNSMAYLEHRIMRKDGTIIYVICLGRNFYDSVAKAERSEITIAKLTDTFAFRAISEVQENKAKQRLARWEDTYRRDNLTGLLNRQAFQNDIDQELLNGKRKILFMMIDIDKFKEFNDSYGHKNGDDQLRTVADIIKATIRDEDLCCRMGGDEFACALMFSKNTPNDVLYQRAQQMFDKANISLSAGEGEISLSMGAVISNRKINTFMKLYENADRLLYESKSKGRSRLSIGDA